jgi:hypothetical protein
MGQDPIRIWIGNKIESQIRIGIEPMPIRNTRANIRLCP